MSWLHIKGVLASDRASRARLADPCRVLPSLPQQARQTVHTTMPDYLLPQGAGYGVVVGMFLLLSDAELDAHSVFRDWSFLQCLHDHVDGHPSSLHWVLAQEL